MFLFIHGFCDTSSGWLPLIRQYFNLGFEYSDQILLDTFTVSMPGYNKPDASFDFDYIEKKILKIIEDKKEIQKSFGDNFLFDKEGKDFAKHLKSPLVYLIGQDAGACACLQFATRHHSSLGGVFLLDFATKYRGFWWWMQAKRINKFLKFDRDKLYSKMLTTDNVLKKRMLGVLTDSISLQGFKSYQNYIQHFDFIKIYNTISMNEQAQLQDLWVFAVNSRHTGFARADEASKLYKLLTQNRELIQDKKYQNTIRLKENKKKTKIQTVVSKISGKGFLDTTNHDKLCTIFNQFLINTNVKF